MSVVHENYKLDRDNLSFEDKGLVLPFGLKAGGIGTLSSLMNQVL